MGQRISRNSYLSCSVVDYTRNGFCFWTTCRLRRAALLRILPDRVILLGGTAAVSTEVEQALAADGFAVERAAGASRIETAVAVATYLFDNLFLGTELPEAYLVRAGAPADNPTAAWADSIAIGPRAAAFESPVLLIPSDGPLHPAVRDFLEAHPPGDLLLVGGEAALSASVLASAEETIGRFPGRIAGSTRLDTARRTGWLLTDEAARVVVDVFDPDGWAYGLAAATFTMPLLGVNGDDVPLETRTAFDPCAATLPCRNPVARSSEPPLSTSRAEAVALAASLAANPRWQRREQWHPFPTARTPLTHSHPCTGRHAPLLGA